MSRARHPLLFGEFDLTLDDGHALVLPADLRRQLDRGGFGSAFVLVVGRDQNRRLYPECNYAALIDAIGNCGEPSDPDVKPARPNPQVVTRIEVDRDGRILLPKSPDEHSNLSREVTVIGVRDHLEIWNRADWKARRDELLSRGKIV
jgi:MraZ protein